MRIPIETIKKYFSGQPVKKVYLFGSTARNEATYQCDIDSNSFPRSSEGMRKVNIF